MATKNDEMKEKMSEDLFLDARKSRPRPDDVMVRFRAMADLVDGDDKNIIINFIKTNPLGADMAVKTLTNRCCAIPTEATRVALEIAEDLVSEMPEEKVREKPYRMQIEMLFYCKKEHVPRDRRFELLPTIRLDTSTDGPPNCLKSTVTI